MSTVINIQNVGTMNISPEFAGSFTGEIERGVEPEALKDLGDQVPEGIIVPPLHEDLEQLEAMEERHEKANAEEDARLKQAGIDANARRTYLIQTIKDAGKQRRAEGFSVTHQAKPKNRKAVESKNFEKQEHGAESLSRACGVCALAKTCAIRKDYGKWVATHPYAEGDQKLQYTWLMQPEVTRTEGRMNFLRRLNKDPLAHCIPPEPAKK